MLKPYQTSTTKTHVFFENWWQVFFHENVVYADIETFFGATTMDVSLNTKAYSQNKTIASIGMHAVGREGLDIPSEFKAQIFVSGDCDPFVEFLRRLLRLCIYWRSCKKNPKPLEMTPENEATFAATSACQHCEVLFGGDVVKCRDHNHYTGAFRAALCSDCNKAAHTPRELRVFTHNGTGYDHHFYILALAKIKTMGGTLCDFAGAPEEWLDFGGQDNVALSAFRLDVLGESAEKIRCITFGIGDIKLMFVDSMKFIKGSLEALIENHVKASDLDLREGFKNMSA